ncbi:GtrA family protein [Arthrobacter alpinus]|nr:GtrA family protein [Arthrobacter alpinus]
MNSTEKIMFLVASLWREVLKFGAVGGLGWLIDNGIYTLLWHGPMSESTIKARVVSTVIATIFAWFANRYWTFRHRRSERVWKEFSLFLVMNVLGLGIVLTCQIISRYVLGLTSFTADFIAGGGIGLILGTIFRFLAYRYFVFTEELSEIATLSCDEGHRETETLNMQPAPIGSQVLVKAGSTN